jgi:hypothetical protein
MKVARSLLLSAVIGLISLGLLLLSFPISALAQTPHSCVLGNPPSHQPSSLGGVTPFSFTWAKACPLNSNAIDWTVYVYDYNNQATPLCTFGPANIPPDTMTGSCAVPKGPGLQVRVTICFERTPGSPMSHSENYYNP